MNMIKEGIIVIVGIQTENKLKSLNRFGNSLDKNMPKENQTNKTIRERFDEAMDVYDSLQVGDKEEFNLGREHLKSFFNQELKNILEELRMEEYKPIDRRRNDYFEDKIEAYNQIVQENNTKIDQIIKREKL